MINRVILIGNLGRDPEVRTLESGTMVAKFSVATNESYKDRNGEWQDLTEWHDVVVWRALAERAQQQLKKGSQVYIEGKLTHRSWQDQNGNNRRTTEVLANTFRLLDRRGGSDRDGDFPGPEDEYPASESSVSKATAATATATEGSDDDDLPF